MVSNKLLEKLNTFDDKRLVNFVVCCHLDQDVDANIPTSQYDIRIQAGAALTDIRVTDIYDTLDLENNISDRNRRYSEMTAGYWIWKNLATEYVGLSHYRRRFQISDDDVSKLLDSGIDIITSPPCSIEGSLEENYINEHYYYDWKLLLDIIDRQAPEYSQFANEYFKSSIFHPCNINIFKASIYEEYGNFIFPILDEFYKNSPLKMDIYQRRDAGFIAERLTSLFVEYKKTKGLKISEVPIKDYRTGTWSPDVICKGKGPDEIYNICKDYYDRHDLLKCRQIVSFGLTENSLRDQRLIHLARIFKLALDEQASLPMTLFEYLPEEWKANLDTLIATYQGLGNIVFAVSNNASQEAVEMLRMFIKATNFSDIAIINQCQNMGVASKSDYILSLIS